jgi:aspartate/tyrosine/aromatic aminotransferase
MKSCWSHVQKYAGDPILGVNVEFAKDPFPQKVNISVGSYKDENGKPYILKCVKNP